MVSHRLLVAVAFICATGCSAIVSPDDGLLGGGDDPVTDAGTDSMIRLMDSGVPPGDSEPPPPRDSAASCTGAPPRCDGNFQVTCVDGSEERIDCALEGDFCDPAEASCEDRRCEPGAARCDGGALFVCDGVGGAEARTDCPHGCSAGACEAEPVVCPGIPPLASGALVRVNTCSAGDDETFNRTAAGEGCTTDQRANGQDLVYAITLTARQRIAIDLRDADSSVGIDTVVYVRRACDDRTSQVACSDDLPCGDTVFGCSGGSGTEVRQSRIITTLDPGVYYVVIDSFDYRSDRGSFTCGDVVLGYVAEPPRP